MNHSAESLALRVCLDRVLCNIQDKHINPRLQIKQGARIIANPSHINNSRYIPEGTEAIQYTARQNLMLLIIDAGKPSKEKQFLLRLAFKKSPFTNSDKLRAAHICDVFGVDGWLVTRRYFKGEAMVLVNAKQHLQ
jgi:hypothetical protein